MTAYSKLTFENDDANGKQLESDVRRVWEGVRLALQPISVTSEAQASKLVDWHWQ